MISGAPPDPHLEELRAEMHRRQVERADAHNAAKRQMQAEEARRRDEERTNAHNAARLHMEKLFHDRRY